MSGGGPGCRPGGPGGLVLAATLALALSAAGCGETEEAPGPAEGTETEERGGGGMLTVTVHFTAPAGESTVAVRRRIRLPGTRPRAAPADSLRAGLRALLRGPTPEEAERGLTSFFSPATADALRSVELRGGRARIDFDDLTGLMPGASSSAGSRALLDQLNATVFQVGSVRSVKYRMRGSCDSFWNWLQRPCRIVVRGDRQLSQDQGGARRGRPEATISHGPARWLLCFPRWAGRVPAEEALASICRSRGRDEDGA